MSDAAQRNWKRFVIGGIAIWISAMVLTAVINDDPADGTPVLIAFAAGGGLFFGAVFGVALWQTRARAHPELDRVYSELAIEPAPAPSASRALAATRSVARIYLVLGAIVTGLGLIAIVQEAFGFGSATVTLYALVAIVVAWAVAVPLVLRRAREAATDVLAPLGLEQVGSRIVGERHGRRVSIEFTGAGSVTRVERDGEPVLVRRRGHDGASWLLDLRDAEELAGTSQD